MGNPTKKLPLIELDDCLLPVERELPGKYDENAPADRAGRLAASGRKGVDGPVRELPAGTRGNRKVGRIDRRLRQRLSLFRMAAGRGARRLVVPRMASRGAGRLSAGRLQRLAAHFAAARQKPGRGVEYFPARCDVCRTAHARLALQNPRARRQRLARPHPRLCDPRGTGRENQGFHRPVLESVPVRLAG